jgi:hypothetical protein
MSSDVSFRGPTVPIVVHRLGVTDMKGCDLRISPSRSNVFLLSAKPKDISEAFFV